MASQITCDCLFNSLLSQQQTKALKSSVLLDLCGRNPMDSPHKGPVMLSWYQLVNPTNQPRFFSWPKQNRSESCASSLGCMATLVICKYSHRSLEIWASWKGFSPWLGFNHSIQSTEICTSIIKLYGHLMVYWRWYSENGFLGITERGMFCVSFTYSF